MRIRILAALLAAGVVAACTSNGNTVTVLGYTVVIKTAPPASAAVGATVPIAFTVTQNESDGTSKPAANQSFTVAVTSGGGTVNGAASVVLTTASDGSVSLTWILGPTVGTQTLRGSVSATHFLDVSITATAAPATQLVFTTAPSATAQSGVLLAVQPTVQLQDAAGRPVAQAGVPVTVSIDVGGGTLGGVLTVNTNATGAAAFTGLLLNGLAGSRTLKFSAVLNGTTVNLPATVVLSAGAGAMLGFTTPPSTTAQSGIALAQQPVVQLQDGAGNPVATAGVPVTVSIDAGGGTLGGVLTVNTNASGTATFSGLMLAGTAGTRTLKFAATVNGVAVSLPATVTLTAGAATQLVVTTQPSPTAQSGAVLAVQPVVQLEDALGNLVAQAGVPVTVTVDVGGGTVGGGPVTVNTNATGAAVFSGLAITGLAGSKTLKFSATVNSLPVTVSSAPVVLAAGAAAQLSVKTQPALTPVVGFPLSIQPAVQIRDGGGNSLLLPGVVVTASIGTGTGTLAGTATATTDAQGVATFTNLRFIGNAGPATLSFAATLSGQPATIASTALTVLLPANGKIVFKSGSDALWVVNPDGSGLLQLTPGYGTSTCQAGDEEPKWSPDGSKIVFTRTQNGAQEIWTMNADGSNQTKLTNSGSPGCLDESLASSTFSENPSWSADGTKIIFTSDRSTTTIDEDLWIMNADGTNQVKFFGSAAAAESEAFFSPDGKTIVFQIEPYNPSGCSVTIDGGEIWLINPDGTNPRRLTTIADCSFEENYSWAPDSRKIAFTSSSNSFGDRITTMNVDGTNRLVLDTNGSEHPGFSPDGTRITFAAGDAIWIMNADGTAKTTINLGTLSDNGMPAWQPILPPGAGLRRSPR